MRWTTKTVVAAVLGAAALAIMASCASQVATKAPMSEADKVARGEYLVTITGCNDCHTPGSLYGTPDTTRLLSGSELGWEGPWGVSYARNLTPDPETGLGNFSADDIVRAIRTGQRLDHSPMLPPMPWPIYSQMTDEDLAAVAAFIKSIPAVSHKVPDRLAPGTKGPAMLSFPPPPAWDAQNIPPPPAAAAEAQGTTKK